MRSGVSSATWAAALGSPWTNVGPDHGVLLREGGRLVGVYVVFHSMRLLDGVDRLFANLGAWCVLPEYRLHSVKMLRALLRRNDCIFTDFSPSGSVVPLNRRMGFSDLDTATDLVVNLPWPSRPGAAQLVHRREEVERLLDGADLQAFRDHQTSAAAHHLVITRGARTCYVVYRRDRRKHLPLFVSVLHASDPELFSDCARLFVRHVLVRHAVPFSLMERRVVGRAPKPRRPLRSTRPKMFRGDVRPEQVDYMYSELTAVPW
jgi:hypothetical protein